MSNNLVTQGCTSVTISRTDVPEWVSWHAYDPNAPAPTRVFSVFRDKLTGVRYGIRYVKGFFSKGWKPLLNGQIDVVLPGEGLDNLTFTQWMAAHTLFGYVSYCIRHGLQDPPKEWEQILPAWVSFLFLYHQGRTIPAD